MCSVPGHATVVHTTGDFAVRKLVVDTFGWLSFKHWFLEVTIIAIVNIVFICYIYLGGVQRMVGESGLQRSAAQQNSHQKQQS